MSIVELPNDYVDMVNGSTSAAERLRNLSNEMGREATRRMARFNMMEGERGATGGRRQSTRRKFCDEPDVDDDDDIEREVRRQQREMTSKRFRRRAGGNCDLVPITSPRVSMSSTLNSMLNDRSFIHVSDDVNSIDDQGIVFHRDMYRFYVGEHEYRVEETETVASRVYKYIEYCMDHFYGFLLAQCDGNIYRIPSLPIAVAHLLAFILQYNGVVVDKIMVCSSQYPVMLAEPVFCFRNSQSSTIEMYVWQNILDDLLDAENSTDVQMDPSLKVDKICTSDLIQNIRMMYDAETPRDVSVLRAQEIAYKLFVIADHAATHLMEDELGSTDWIYHTRFGDSPMETLSAMLLIREMNTELSVDRLSASTMPHERLETYLNANVATGTLSNAALEYIR